MFDNNIDDIINKHDIEPSSGDNEQISIIKSPHEFKPKKKLQQNYPGVAIIDSIEGIQNTYDSYNDEQDMQDAQDNIIKINKPQKEQKSATKLLNNLNKTGDLKLTESSGSKDELKSIFNIDNDYHEIDLGTKIVRVRKWKAKDRKAFKAEMSKLNNTSDDIKIMKATFTPLVHSCLETPTALTPKEMQYLFNVIRSLSISNTFDYERLCNNCQEITTHQINISDVCKPLKGNLNDIKYKGIVFKLKTPELAYNQRIYDDNFGDISNFANHIESINGKHFNIKDIIQVLEEQNSDFIDQILDLFEEQCFDFDDKHELTCPHCGAKEVIKFDKIPNLLPTEWYSKL